MVWAFFISVPKDVYTGCCMNPAMNRRLMFQQRFAAYA